MCVRICKPRSFKNKWILRFPNFSVFPYFTHHFSGPDYRIYLILGFVVFASELLSASGKA